MKLTGDVKKIETRKNQDKSDDLFSPKQNKNQLLFPDPTELNQLRLNSAVYADMEPYEESNTQKNKKRERRTRDNDCDRHYSCGCGKTYLSYAALYTHTKMKHNGVLQKGSQTASKRRQGKPRQNDQSSIQNNPNILKLHEFNKEFDMFLGMIPEAMDHSKTKSSSASFPISHFINESTYLKIFESMSNLETEINDCIEVNNYENLENMIFEFLQNKNFTTIQIFALFLIYVNRFVSRAFFNDLCFFVVSYQLMLNKYGFTKLREMGIVNDNKDEFCLTQSGEFLPDFCNIYLVKYFSGAILNNEVVRNQNLLTYFGIEDVKLLRVILTTKQFCNWLSVMKFTKAKIEILKD